MSGKAVKAALLPSYDLFPLFLLTFPLDTGRVVKERSVWSEARSTHAGI
jgi:hypothetical protein